MRSAVLILALLLVLGGAFYFLIVRDRPLTPGVAGPTATQPTTRRMVPTTAGAGEAGESAIGRSSGVWVQSRDATGRIASQYLFERLDPRKDGAVDVVRPQAQFFGRNGGIMTLDGESGIVAYSQAGDREDVQAMGTATPTSGTLRDVTIRFYDDLTEADSDKLNDAEPSLVATVPALRFDALDNRLATVDSVIAGKGVLAEQVPVQVRGRDYEFDGYGLIMRWNDRDGRLEQLVINRGERLRVSDVSRFTSRGEGEAARTERQPAPPRPTAAARERRESTPSRAQGGRAAARQPTPATAPSSRELYHATFDQNVRVTRSGAEVAQAEVLAVVIPLSKNSGTTRPAATATTRATTRPNRPRPAAARPTNPTQPAATTRPAEPLEIRWTGKLTVRPVDAEPERVAEGAMVEFVGSPARVFQDGASVEGRLIHVEPDTGRVRVEPGGPVKAIALTGADGGQLRSRSALLVDQSAGRATIEGAGALLAPPAEAGQTQASVKWSRRLELALEQDDGPGGSSWLRAATIEGDARVEAEAFAMTGDAIALGFDKPAAPATKPSQDGLAMPAPDARQLRLVTARGGARIEAGPVDRRRSLAGQELRLGFAAGADGPALTTLNGTGDVAMIDADGTEFASQSLDVATVPTALVATTQPTSTSQPADAIAMIEKLDAHGDVRLRRNDGTTATGDRLTMVVADGAKRLALEGAPARAGTARGEVIATRVEIDPQTRDVTVPVAGRIESADPAKPGTTMSIAWDRTMSLDATAGECVIDGAVQIASTDEAGSTMNAKARSATVAFDPQTIAATRPTTVAAASSRPTVGDSLRSLVLRDDVVLEMHSPDGRESGLETAVLNIDVAKNLITADRPGRMKVIQRPTTRPATDTASTRPARHGTMNGSMGVEWQGALRWDLKPGDLALTGGVRVGYDRENKGDVIRIAADRLLGKLTPVDLAARDQTAAVELRTIRAVGNVQVKSTLAMFDAATLEYDLSRTTAQASGDALRDVQVYDSTGASNASFGAITWNVETGAIENVRDIRSQLRR